MADFTLTASDDGRSIQVPIGSRINIDLPENPTTGYRWKLRGPESKLLALELDSYGPAENAGTGGGGIRHLSFRAKAPGQAAIILKNAREWEPDEMAIRSFSITVTVI